MAHLRFDAQRVRHTTLSMSLMRMLQAQEQSAWLDIAALDESWSYCSANNESMWLGPVERVSERPRVRIQGKSG
jgi:hypothetical protein